MKNITNINRKNKTVKQLIALALAFALVTSAAACSSITNADTRSDGSVNTEETADTSEMYSDRDYETEYDESDAQTIELNSDSITITEEGTYVISGTLKNGSIIVEAGDEDKIQIVLDGVDITSGSSACIYVKSADKVFITTAEGSTNTLTNKTGFEADGETNVDAVIFSKDDLTLNGEGMLIIESADNGITSKDELVITGGTYEVTAEGHALQGKDSIAIDGGEFTLTSGEDAIHAKNSDDTSLGDVVIDSGTFTINAGDDAVHAESDLVINGGNFEIASCNEGLEGNTVTITDGGITINAHDDAINAAGQSSDTFAEDTSAWINISGGTIEIKCSGDGIDSNGSLTISGGYITISGPENNGNGSIDYNTTASITGGTLIACGSSGMAQNITEATQGSILVTTETKSAGTEVTVTDEDGNEILSFTPDASYSCIIVSSPDLKDGETYTITAGTGSQEITLDGNIYGQTMGMGQMPGDMPSDMPDGMPGDMQVQMPGGDRGQRPQRPGQETN